MLAYSLNCWLMLFNREEDAKVETLQHTTLATARLRFLFLAAKIWRHAGRYMLPVPACNLHRFARSMRLSRRSWDRDLFRAKGIADASLLNHTFGGLVSPSGVWILPSPSGDGGRKIPHEERRVAISS
jgi:hypothetical protein